MVLERRQQTVRILIAPLAGRRERIMNQIIFIRVDADQPLDVQRDADLFVHFQLRHGDDHVGVHDRARHFVFVPFILVMRDRFAPIDIPRRRASRDSAFHTRRCSDRG